MITAKGMRLFAVIDQAAEARRVGLTLRETTLVIFGSPQAGTPVMAAAPLSALDLPLKVLVWADGERGRAPLSDRPRWPPGPPAQQGPVVLDRSRIGPYRRAGSVGPVVRALRTAGQHGERGPGFRVIRFA